MKSATDLDPALLTSLREALGPDAVDERPAVRQAYARDLWTLGHLAFASGAAPPGAGNGDADPLAGAAPPQAVVRPRTVEEVQAVLAACHARRVPVIPWGAGSGVCGGTLAVRGGVALDLKGLDRLLELDRRSLLVRVEPGLNLQLLEDALNREGLTLGHHPSSITCSTIGGALAARGAGQLSTRYGKAEDMVVGLEVLLADGARVATPVAPRAATGPDWNQLFVGCEGTLGVIVGATLRVHLLPALRLFRSYLFGRLEDALEAIRVGLQRGARPAAVRLYDPLDTLMVARAGDGPPPPDAAELEAVAAEADPDAGDDGPLGVAWPHSGVSLRGLREALAELVPEAARLGKRALLGHPELANRLTARIPGVGCLLLLTFEGEPELARAEEAVFRRVCEAGGAVALGPEPAERWWRNRLAVSFKQTGVYALGGFVDTMEVATRWDRLEELHERVRAAIGAHALVMAHFSHAYPDGCSIYFTFAALREEPEATRARYRSAWRDGLAAVVACGAAVSHHHGVGILKADALKESLGALHPEVFVRVKQALDPQNILNPGKLGLP